jgi:hypothetical protein
MQAATQHLGAGHQQQQVQEPSGQGPPASAAPAAGEVPAAGAAQPACTSGGSGGTSGSGASQKLQGRNSALESMQSIEQALSDVQHHGGGGNHLPEPGQHMTGAPTPG